MARVSGTITQINYKPGQRVRKGDLLFVIEPQTYIDEVEQAQASLREGQANLAYLKANYERTKEAIKANAVSQIQLIEAQANYEQAVATLKNYDAALTTSKTNLSYCYIRAPFAGTVSNYTYDVGNYVSGSSAPTLATIYKDDKMYVYFNVADIQYLNMAVSKDREKPQSMAELSDLIVIPDAQDDMPNFSAKLDYFAPNIDLSTGTINMRGEIDNPGTLLKDGLYVKVILPYESKSDAILVPDASIGTDQLGRYVYLVNDSNKVVYQRVDVGQLLDTYRVINSGVEAGDRYVTTALLKVRPGMVIDPIMNNDKENKK